VKSDGVAAPAPARLPPGPARPDGAGADAVREVRRSARNGLIGLAGAAVSGVCGFVLTTVIARGFGTVDSGALFTAVGLVTVLGAVCCLGADTALIWALPRRRAGAGGDAARLLPVALLPPMLLAAAVAGVGVAAAGAVAPHLLDRAGASGAALIRLAFAALPVAVAMTVLLAAVRAARPIGAYVAVQFLLVPVSRPALVGAAILAGGGGMGGVVLGFGAWSLPLLAGAAVSAALAVRPLGLRAGASLRPTRADWRTLWGFALPRAGSAVIDASSMWMGVLLTALLAGQAQAGVFGAVGRYVLAGQLAMQGLRVAVAPQLSRLLGQGRRAEAASVYRQTTTWIIALSWPAYLLLAVFAPAFLALFGPGFAAGAPAMAVLAAAMLVNSGAGIVQTVLLMSGDSRRHLLATALGLTLNVLVGVALIPPYGALGAAISWSLGIVVENVVAAFGARTALARPLITRSLAWTAAGAGGGAGLACALAVAVAGRGPAGLAVALALLAAGCAALLASRRVRARLRGLAALARPRTT
jgi:O-antigen/teichoic acid export membrane protein